MRHKANYLKANEIRLPLLTNFTVEVTESKIMHCNFFANTKINFTIRKTDVTFLVKKSLSEKDFH